MAVKRIKIDDEDILADIMVRFIGVNFFFFFTIRLNLPHPSAGSWTVESSCSSKRCEISWLHTKERVYEHRSRVSTYHPGSKRNINVGPKSRFPSDMLRMDHYYPHWKHLELSQRDLLRLSVLKFSVDWNICMLTRYESQQHTFTLFQTQA